MDQQPLKPGWSRPKPETLPRPTYWPITLSLGVTFVAWGILTTWIVTAVGAVMVVAALIGWIGDIRNEQRQEEQAE